MALSPPQEREPIHTRTITCQGYRRTDRLWDVEGHLTDVKSYSFKNNDRGEITPGTPIHEMWLRITVDDHFTIIDAEASTVHGPFNVCGAINPAYKQLIGLRITSGFTRQVKERLGGVHGCTHLTELVGSVATAAFQTIFPILARLGEDEPPPQPKTKRPPPLLNTCHALASDGAIAEEHWPDYYTGSR
ncbi:MAG: DUF2889 domain-containing protein [Rhodospirillaceae bacterium]|nr:DUF2889 domain-containing protein [Rhodospirillaceae bacterium]